jgi:hypothetical protein
MPISFEDLIRKESGVDRRVSFDDLIPQEQPSTLADAGKSFASGVGRGVTGLIGLPGTISDAFNNGMSYVTGLPRLPQSPLSSETITNAANYVSNDALAYEPKTTAGEYAGTVGEFLPGAALGGANVGNLVRFGVLPGLASEAAGQATEGTSVEPYARIAAALVAPAAPALAARAISPYSGAISAERQALVDALRAEGVNPTAGQATGSRALRFAESELGGQAARDVAEAQGRAFTEAAMSRAGPAGLATTDNMAANADRLGAGFEAISARNSINADPQFAQGIGRVLNEYDRVLPSAQRQIVGNMADDIIASATNNAGTIPGPVYQSTRSRLGRMAQSARNSDPEFANALRGLRNTLDDAMTRSVRPEDAVEWQTLRREYGNMRTLERAAAGAGDSAAEGFISPAKLRQSASTGRQGQYVRGTGDLDELARAGQILSPLPDSGTASRLAVRGLMSAPAAAGAIAGGYSGDVLTGLAGAAAGAAVPAMAGRALMSRPIQAYLQNQAAPNMTIADPRMLAIIQALIANGAR